MKNQFNLQYIRMRLNLLSNAEFGIFYNKLSMRAQALGIQDEVLLLQLKECAHGFILGSSGIALSEGVFFVCSEGCAQGCSEGDRESGGRGMW